MNNTPSSAHLLEFAKVVVVDVEGADFVLVHDVRRNTLQLAALRRAIGIWVVGPFPARRADEFGLEPVGIFAAAADAQAGPRVAIVVAAAGNARALEPGGDGGRILAVFGLPGRLDDAFDFAVDRPVKLSLR